MISAQAAPGTAEPKEQLDRRGWALVADIASEDEAQLTLAELGHLMPQLDESIAYPVVAKPGYENLPYTRSTSAIGPHTEAPVYDPPPRYLALHCHRQAACGGGQTQLLDGRLLEQALRDDARLYRYATETTIEFTATATRDDPRSRRARFPLLSGPARSILRFSHNQFTFGDVNPGLVNGAACPRAPADPELGEILKLTLQLFERQATATLIPEDGLLIWDNHRMLHGRTAYQDASRHLTRYWLR